MGKENDTVLWSNYIQNQSCIWTSLPSNYYNTNSSYSAMWICTKIHELKVKSGQNIFIQISHIKDFKRLFIEIYRWEKLRHKRKANVLEGHLICRNTRSRWIFKPRNVVGVLRATGKKGGRQRQRKTLSFRPLNYWTKPSSWHHYFQYWYSVRVRYFSSLSQPFSVTTVSRLYHQKQYVSWK